MNKKWIATILAIVIVCTIGYAFAMYKSTSGNYRIYFVLKDKYSKRRTLYAVLDGNYQKDYTMIIKKPEVWLSLKIGNWYSVGFEYNQLFKTPVIRDIEPADERFIPFHEEMLKKRNKIIKEKKIKER